MLPYVSLTGNAVADAEIRFTHGGKPIGSLRVACSNRIKGADGNWTDGEATFISVTVFGALAEPVAEQVRKGTKVCVTGRLKQRSWEAQDGSKRTDYEIVADEVSVGLKPVKQSVPQQSDDPWAQTPTEGPGNEPQEQAPPF